MLWDLKNIYKKGSLQKELSFAFEAEFWLSPVVGIFEAFREFVLPE